MPGKRGLRGFDWRNATGIGEKEDARQHPPSFSIPAVIGSV